MTFYYAKTEFYGNGTVKTCIGSQKAKKMPEDQHRETPIADCYTDWFVSREDAERFLRGA